MLRTASVRRSRRCSALEYGRKKEDTELIDTAFGKFGIERRATKVEVAPVIARKPGFEPFFLAVVDEVYVAVILEWTAPPDDLDLHAWLERGGVHTHVARGWLSGRPCAALHHRRR